MLLPHSAYHNHTVMKQGLVVSPHSEGSPLSLLSKNPMPKKSHGQIL
jgi:hypothetical protein